MFNLATNSNPAHVKVCTELMPMPAIFPRRALPIRFLFSRMFTDYAHQTRTNKIDDRCETSQEKKRREEQSASKVRDVVSFLSLSLETSDGVLVSI